MNTRQELLKEEEMAQEGLKHLLLSMKGAGVVDVNFSFKNRSLISNLF